MSKIIQKYWQETVLPNKLCFTITLNDKLVHTREFLYFIKIRVTTGFWENLLTCFLCLQKINVECATENKMKLSLQKLGD